MFLKDAHRGFMLFSCENKFLINFTLVSRLTSTSKKKRKRNEFTSYRFDALIPYSSIVILNEKNDKKLYCLIHFPTRLMY